MSESNDPPVTVVLSRHVLPGAEEAYEALLHRIVSAASTFPGHLGTNIFRPTDKNDPEYRVIFKFTRKSDYQRWMDSAERSQLHQELEPLVSGESRLQVFDGLEAWFDPNNCKKNASPHPPRHRMAVVIWLCIFPLITLLNIVWAPLMTDWPIYARTALITLCAVPLMTWLLVPWMSRRLAFWLNSP